MHRSTQPDEKRFWTPLRAALTLAAMLLLASFGVSSCNSSEHNANANASQSANAAKINMTVKGAGGDAKSSETKSEAVMLPAPVLNASLKTVDGNAFKLSDLQGKVLVVDLWATWCPPCRNEVPELVKLQTEYGPRGLEVVGLDIDKGEAPETVNSFIKEFKINYKVGYLDTDLARSLMTGGNIPQSLVVGRDGHVIIHFIGFDPGVTSKKLRAAVEQALE
jgi:thiol-disulfide isomerase/thioredoxin